MAAELIYLDAPSDEGCPSEKALARSERRYRRLFEQSNDAILLCRLDGAIIDANKNAIALLGVDPTTLFQRPLTAILPQFEDAQLRDRLLASEQCRLTTDLHTANERILTVEISACLLDRSSGTIQLIVQRVSSRQHSLGGRRPGAPEVAALLSAAADTVFHVDLSGAIRHLNRALPGCGWTSEEMRGQLLAEFLHPQDRPKLVERLGPDTAGRVASHSVTIRFRGKPMVEDPSTSVSGGQTETASFAVTTAAISADGSDAGPLLGHWVLCRSLARENALVSEVNHLNARLMQAQKMEVIGALTCGVAHDFNNTLSAIFGNTQLAQMALPKAHKAQDYLHHIRAAGHRAKRLVDQILAFSRPRNASKQPIDIASVAKEAYELLRTTLPSTIEIRQKFASQGRTILGDRTQIHQVLMNLATNAFHALDGDSGHIEIAVTAEELTPSNIGDEGLTPGSYLRLTVSDDGCGMDADIQPHIFEPYFTTKAAGQGTGLGLPTVMGIVEDHGGVMRVQSAPGSGTTFQILFPCHTLPEEPTVPEAPKLRAGSEQVLFVDDETALVDLVEEMLTELGYRVDAKTCPLEALAAFRQKPNAYQLVITDMNMPGMTGVRLAEAILHRQPEVPVLICSGYVNAIDLTKITRLGICGIIEKPFTIHRLSMEVRQALDRAVDPGNLPQTPIREPEPR